MVAAIEKDPNVTDETKVMLDAGQLARNFAWISHRGNRANIRSPGMN